MSKYLRIELLPTDAKHLMCIACGRLHPHVEFEIRTDGEAQAGIHKACFEMVHAKRGQ